MVDKMREIGNERKTATKRSGKQKKDGGTARNSTTKKMHQEKAHCRDNKHQHIARGKNYHAKRNIR